LVQVVEAHQAVERGDRMGQAVIDLQ